MNQNNGVPTTDATSAAGSSADFSTNIQDQFGVPPTPPVPDFLSSEPSMPGVNPNVMADLTNTGPTPITGNNGTGVVQDNVNSDVTPEVTAIEGSNTEVKDAQFEEVKKQMFQDLYPLMDKIKMQPEQKFKVYKQMIESTGSKDMITSAYEAVKEISNEQEKAEALLFLVEKADS